MQLKAVRTYDLKAEGIDYTSEKFGLYINGTRGTLARYLTMIISGALKEYQITAEPGPLLIPTA